MRLQPTTRRAFLARVSASGLLSTVGVHTSLGGEDRHPPVKGVCGLNPFNRRVKAKFLKHSELGYVSLRVGWDQLEAAPGQVDPAPILRELERIRAAGKLATLRVAGGAFSPKWTHDVLPTQETRRNRVLPIPYTAEYIARFTAMITKLGEQLRDQDELRLIHLCGPADGGEMDLVKPHNQLKPPSIPYDKELVLVAWQRAIDTYQAAFPSQELALSIVNPYKADQLLEEVLTYFRRQVGSRATIQNNSLHDGTRVQWKISRYIREWPHNKGHQFLGTAARTGDVAKAAAIGSGLGGQYLEALIGIIESDWDVLSDYPAVKES